MSEEKKPRFLQQTTSQLLHQQEALRKRREMLERESTKPPAMRFGTNSPPHTAIRGTRSPPPPPLFASERQAAHLPTPSSNSCVHRELTWSRPDEESMLERGPMRFSMMSSLTSAPVAQLRPQVAPGSHTPALPTPRDVNTSHCADGLLPKRRREHVSPQTVSPRSPVVRRGRFDPVGTSSENTLASIESPVASGGSAVMRHAIISDTPEGKPATTSISMENRTPVRTTNTTTAAELSPATSQEVGYAQAAEGIAAFSHTFPVPRFTTISPIAIPSVEKLSQQQDGKLVEQRREETPMRGAVGGFQTPRPVSRLSTALTPVVGSQPPERETSAERNASPSEGGKETNVMAKSSPPPQELKLAITNAAAAVSTVSPKTNCQGGDEGAEHASEPRAREEAKVTVPPTRPVQFGKEVNALPESSPHRSKSSPGPKPDSLLQSAQVSIEKRPCGCERQAMSPARQHRSEARCATSKTVSPQPIPTPLTHRPLTDIETSAFPCYDGPTPVSIPSQPAASDSLTPVYAPASPLPTPNNIMSGLHGCANEPEVRRRPSLDGNSSERDDGAVSERFSNEEGKAPTTYSPRVSEPKERCYTVKNAERSAYVAWKQGDNISSTANTPSPVPSEKQYGQSVLASVEKRCCHRPAPSERQALELENGLARSCPRDSPSASPQPSARHLLSSLNVSFDKGSQHTKPPERGTESRESVAGKEGDTHQQHSALRTPSPTPTAEHVIASLQASAEKRVRSGAVEGQSSTALFSSCATDHPASPTYQSPMLTPQNVTESVQKIVREQEQMQTRSDARAPSRPWLEESGEVHSNRKDQSAWNSSASPMISAEDVDMSLETLERDERYKSRSLRAPRVSNPVDEQSSAAPTLRTVEVFAESRSEEVVQSTGSAEAASDLGITSLSGIAPTSHDLAMLPSVISPVPSELAVPSALFFDCVSAPQTPALGTLEELKLSAKSVSGSIPSVIPVDAPHVPEQFFALQREVSAISAGRSRTRTPPPLQASEQSSPSPQLGLPCTESEAQPCTVERVEQANLDEVKEKSLGHAVDRGCEGALAAHKAKRVDPRGSLILVHPTTSPQPVIHYPHQPIPEPPAPTISPVQVPLSRTPPPRPMQLKEPQLVGVASHVITSHGNSPLPRPVTLRSQVSLASPPLPIATSWNTAAFVSKAAEPSTHGLGSTPGGISGHASHVFGDVPRGGSFHTGPEEEDGVDLFESKNDWMDLVEPLRPYTITVSPQGGAVVCTTHSSSHGPPHLSETERTTTELYSPSPSRMCSQSTQSPLVEGRQSSAMRRTLVATPASVALSINDGFSTGGKRSSGVAATPNSVPSQTTSSSPRCRKSQAEELLEMLPVDSAEEVKRMEDAVEDETRATLGSLEGRLSGVSDGDSILGYVSSISQRVSQRPSRAPRNYDSYIQYLESMATSSAKKTRKAAGRRMHKTVVKDIACTSANASPGDESLSPVASRSSNRSISASLSRAQRNTAVPVSRSTSKKYSASPKSLTPVLNSPRTKLVVSTRLSTEVEKALFQQTPPPKARQGPKSTLNNASRPSSSSRRSASKKAHVPAPKRKGAHTSQHRTVAPHKKPTKKFITAKTLRSAKPRKPNKRRQ